MKRALVTGGTVFVSRSMAEHLVRGGWEVYVLNRGSRRQSSGVRLIRADRHDAAEALRGLHFDLVVDTAYNAHDVETLLDSLESFDDYVLISSSAVYPEYLPQPFREDTPVGPNRFWGQYGADKIAAEEALLQRVSGAYVLRPPYLYGPLNNVYREAFVFDCAAQGRPFFLPGEGSMGLQFLHVRDLCRFVDVLLETRPAQRVFNVGNTGLITVREWVAACYAAVGTTPEFVCVEEDVEQRSYFSFYDYEYCLDVSAQHALMPEETPLAEGLREAWAWYRLHGDEVNRKPLMAFIDSRWPR